MRILSLIFILSIALFSKDIILGVVPQQSPLKLSKKWIQVTNYLTKETGLNIIFKTQKSIPLFEEKLYAGTYDFAYMNPYHFVIANKKQNYEAKIRANKKIVGIVLAASKEEKITYENLKGKTFLFPAPNAFAATLLTKYELKNKYNFDIDKEANVLYVNSHDSVYKGIARGIGDFGGGIIRTYNNFVDKNSKDKINIVYKTSSYPSHPFAFHPRVSKEDVDKICQALINMPNDLKSILSIKKFIKTENKEFDIIKQFGE